MRRLHVTVPPVMRFNMYIAYEDLPGRYSKSAAVVVAEVAEEFGSSIGNTLVLRQGPSERRAGQGPCDRIESAGPRGGKKRHERRQDSGQRFECSSPIHDLEDANLFGQRQVGKRRHKRPPGA